MTTFTASEVVAKLRDRFASGNDVPVPDVRLTRAEFDVIADLLEADEKAEPVMYTWSKEPDKDGVFRKIPLYTHPQPAQDAKDAARYRWLRDMRNREQAAMLVSFKMNLDAAIDAAMVKESGNE